jgi:hypothetical protein
MSTEIIIILGGIGVAVLGILILSLGKKLARFLIIAGGLAAVVVFALAMLAQASASRQAAQAATEAARAAEVASVGQTATSAALSIIVFLALVLVLVILLAVGGVAAWLWWQKYQRQTCYQEMMAQAQMYAAMNGVRPVAPPQPRPALPYHQVPAGSSPVIIVSGAAPQYPYQPTVVDLSGLQTGQGQGNPLTGLLPPMDDETWG